jgi:hypothetical protein
MNNASPSMLKTLRQAQLYKSGRRTDFFRDNPNVSSLAMDAVLNRTRRAFSINNYGVSVSKVDDESNPVIPISILSVGFAASDRLLRWSAQPTLYKKI